jgi:DNA-binding NarL/FixJ family response regulator
MTLVAARAAGLDAADRCQPQRVLVVHEHELIAAGLRAVLAEEHWIESCLVVGSAEAALPVARRYHPQLVLVSTSLGGRSAPELCGTLTQRLPHIKVVLLSGEGRVSAALALSLGAVSALSTHLPAAVLVSALGRIAEGARVFPKGASCPDDRLSRRESDVLQHLASGLSNPEVAARLNLSRHTVKQHTSAVYRKLGVRNRAEAASRALELGLLLRGEQQRRAG